MRFMSKDMCKAVSIVFICGIAWLIAGAVLVSPPESVQEWGAFLLLALGWFALGYGFGGGAGYYTAHKEGNKVEDKRR